MNNLEEVQPERTDANNSTSIGEVKNTDNVQIQNKSENSIVASITSSIDLDNNTKTKISTIKIKTKCLILNNEIVCDTLDVKNESKDERDSRLNQAISDQEEEEINKDCKNETFTCNICSKSFLKKRNLTTHIRIHSNNKCQICDESFTRKTTLNRHMLVHKVTKSYKCDECNKTFRNKQCLSKHKLIHIAEQSYWCESKTLEPVVLLECTETVNDVPDNTMNINDKITGEAISMSNPTIYERFSINEEDVVQDDKNKIYKCNLCHKSFTLKYNLSVHMRTHAGIKPFQCEICYESFGRKNTLTRHILIHTGDKPHKCDQCKKAFRHKQTLNQHKLGHRNAKPYWCEICNKHFKDRKTVSNHQKKYQHLVKKK